MYLKHLLNFRSGKEDYLQSLARDNCQLLINKIWEVCTWFIRYIIAVVVCIGHRRMFSWSSWPGQSTRTYVFIFTSPNTKEPVSHELPWAICMDPTRTGKPGKMRKLFPVREKSGNFTQILEKWGILPKILENEDILASFYFYFSLTFKLKCIC